VQVLKLSKEKSQDFGRRLVKKEVKSRDMMSEA
jgi:hypothetical protein